MACVGMDGDEGQKQLLSSEDDAVQLPKQQRERVWAVSMFAVIAAIPALLVGCTLGFPSSAVFDLRSLPSAYRFNTALLDLFGALAPIGALFGGPIAGWVADKYGRKPCLMLVGVPYLTGYLLLAYGHMVTEPVAFKCVVLLGRFVTGIGLGWSCLAVPVYTAEISSAKFRGIFASFTQLFLSIGLVVVYSIGSSTLMYYDVALVVAGIVALFQVFMLFPPESPKWLFANHQQQRSIRVLHTLRGPNFSVDKELIQMKSAVANPQLSIREVLRQFLRRSVIQPLLITVAVMFFQQIGGLNASTAYSAAIFDEAGVKNPKQTAAYAVGATGVLFTVVSMFIVDFVGRKIMLIVSGAGMLLGTVMLGSHFYITRPSLCSNSSLVFDSDAIVCNTHYAPLAIVSLIVFNAAFSIGWGPVPWIFLGEYLPLRIRGTASGIATFVNWGTAAIVTGFYLDYAEQVKPWFAWWTFSVFNLAGIVFVVIFVFETKGKSLEEIQRHFESKEKKTHV